MRRAVALLALAAAAVAACGGNDRKDAEKTVRAYIDATKAGDAKRFCDDLVTKAFVENLTAATGDEARGVCRRQFRSLRREPIRLVSIGPVRVRDDRARVVAVIEAHDQRLPQLFRLAKEDGSWRVDLGGG